MKQQQLGRIIYNLTRPVWTPKKVVAQPRKTWRKLKVGDRLRNKQDMKLDTLDLIVKNSEWEVTHVDSLGAQLAQLRNGELLADDAQASYTLREPDWAALFTKQRKQRGKDKLDDR
jgi:plasmid replication initiation protein